VLQGQTESWAIAAPATVLESRSKPASQSHLLLILPLTNFCKNKIISRARLPMQFGFFS
jgi:hypothetical protein